MTEKDHAVEAALILAMEDIMLRVANDETISEEDRTERLRRGRQYIAARGRSELLA